MNILRQRAVAYMLPVALLLVISATTSAQTGPVNYTATLDKNPTSHFVRIALTVKNCPGRRYQTWTIFRRRVIALCQLSGYYPLTLTRRYP